MTSKLAYWSYLTTEEPYTKAASLSRHLKRLPDKKKSELVKEGQIKIFDEICKNLHSSAIYAASCTHPVIWKNVINSIDRSLTKLQTCLTEKSLVLMHVESNEEKKTTSPNTLLDLSLKIKKMIHFIKAFERSPTKKTVEQGIEKNVKDVPKAFIRWSLRFFQTVTKFIQKELPGAEKYLPDLMYDIFRESRHIFFEALVYFNNNRLNKKKEHILQQNLIKQIRIAVHIHIRKASFLEKFDKWSKEQLETLSPIPKDTPFTEVDFLFLDFFLQHLNYSSIDISEKMPFEKILKKMELLPPLSDQEKKEALDYYSCRFLERLPCPKDFDDIEDFLPFQVPSFVFWSVYPCFKDAFETKYFPKKFLDAEKLLSNQVLIKKLNLAKHIGLKTPQDSNKLNQRKLARTFPNLEGFVREINGRFLAGFFGDIHALHLVLRFDYFPLNSLHMLYKLSNHPDQSLFQKITDQNTAFDAKKSQIKDFSKELEKSYYEKTYQLQYLLKIYRLAKKAFPPKDIVPSKEEKKVPSLFAFWDEKEQFLPKNLEEKKQDSPDDKPHS